LPTQCFLIQWRFFFFSDKTVNEKIASLTFLYLLCRMKNF